MNTPLLNILVPTEFSKQSEAALEEAIAWADPQRGTIILLHVAGTSYWPITETWPEPDDGSVFAVDLRRDSKERLRAMQDAEIGSKVRSEVHVLEGVPHKEITRFAEQRDVDLVVIASHGHSRLKRFPLGSTAERIVRAVPCPVLLVRDRASASNSLRRGLAGLGKILVATDFSESSARALERAIDLAKHSDAEIVLFHVVRGADYPTRQVLSQRAWKEIRGRCERRLERLQEDRIGDTVRSRILLGEGVPSAEIADATGENEIDLVVIGPSGHTGGNRFFLGSTAERVVRVAPCSVYVEKEKARQKQLT